MKQASFPSHGRAVLRVAIGVQGQLDQMCKHTTMLSGELEGTADLQ